MTLDEYLRGLMKGSLTARERAIVEALKTLDAWASTHRYVIHVVSDVECYCDFAPRTIVIERRLGLEKKYTILLHELGHVLWHESVRGKSIDGVFSTVPYHALTDKYKISVIEEEIDAWIRAQRLGARLTPLAFDEKRFRATKAQCLKAYFKKFFVQ